MIQVLPCRRMKPLTARSHDRDPDQAVLCISVPKTMKLAVRRRGVARGLSDSALIRDWLLPMLLAHDPQFAIDWESHQRREIARPTF